MAPDFGFLAPNMTLNRDSGKRGIMPRYQFDANYQTNPGANPTNGAGGSSQDAYAQLIQEYLNEIKALSDPNSAYSQSIRANAAGAAGRRSAGAGVQGGLAGANTAQYVANASLNAKMGLLGMQGQAIGMGETHDRYVNDFNYRQQMDAYNQQQGQRAGMMGMLGGLGGAAIGGAIGGPAGVGAGWSAGSQIGGGLAGIGAPPAPYKPYGSYSGSYGGNY